MKAIHVGGSRKFIQELAGKRGSFPQPKRLHFNKGEGRGGNYRSAVGNTPTGNGPTSVLGEKTAMPKRGRMKC